jgi:hypothetical protein
MVGSPSRQQCPQTTGDSLRFGPISQIRRMSEQRRPSPCRVQVMITGHHQSMEVERVLSLRHEVDPLGTTFVHAPQPGGDLLNERPEGARLGV